MWDVGLAKMLKERDNKNKIGVCIGKIVGTNPLQVSILNGDIVLEQEQLYICSNLLEKKFNFTMDASDITSSPVELATISISNKDSANIILNYKLNISDEVLIVPTESGQVFFIVDKVTKVGD